MPLDNQRKSGVLLHITSLPGPYGIGEIGADAYRFVDMLAAMGQSVWQVLPINPVVHDEAPYSAQSSLACHDILLCLRELARIGLADADDLEPLSRLPKDRLDFDRAVPARRAVLARILRRFPQRASAALKTAYQEFCAVHDAVWLDDHALFSALTRAYYGAPWMHWPKELAQRDPAALAWARKVFKNEIAAVKVGQFLFDRQWRALKTYANGKGIDIMGDMPIYVSQNSDDVWASQHCFELDENGDPLQVSGVPPDAFAETGQRWGTPLYDWDAMARDGYAWWARRIRRLSYFFDIIRIDHFRAFAQYWSIPAGEETGENGAWRDAPGRAVLEAIYKAAGGVSFVAEDLGHITPDVYALRDAFALPGMKILQFEFEDGRLFGPEDTKVYPENSACYAGCHDNDTARGWLASLQEKASNDPDAADAMRNRLKDAFGPLENADQSLVRFALAAGSNLAMTQFQDILRLDGAARMNLPGTIKGNWKWRFQWADVPTGAISTMRRWTEQTERSRRTPQGQGPFAVSAERLQPRSRNSPSDRL